MFCKIFFIRRSHKCMNNILNRSLFFFCYLYLFLSFFSSRFLFYIILFLLTSN
ncbi:hypothetical protein BMB171_C4007 [Bacillus thuringiensis BMB171]|nr:hypothetical protein BMB171_C4007 [Bacillus thuringiensis BMB171]